jgi:hypothetical protein
MSKINLKLLGIQPATFRLVAQGCIQCRLHETVGTAKMAAVAERCKGTFRLPITQRSAGLHVTSVVALFCTFFVEEK